MKKQIHIFLILICFAYMPCKADSKPTSMQRKNKNPTHNRNLEKLLSTTQKKYTNVFAQPVSIIAQEVNELLLQRELLKQEAHSVKKQDLQQILYNLDKEKAFEKIENKRLIRKLTNLFLKSLKIEYYYNFNIDQDQMIFIHENNAPALFNLVKNHCEKLPISMPLIILIDDYSTQQAFSRSWSHDIASIILFKNCVLYQSYEELNAIIAHELGHIYHHHQIIRESLTIAITFLLFMSASYTGKYAINVKSLPFAEREKNIITKLFYAAILFPAWVFAKKSLSILYKYQEKEADTTMLTLTKNPELFERLVNKSYIANEHINKEQERAGSLLKKQIEKTLDNNKERTMKFIQKNLELSLWQRIRNFMYSNTHPKIKERIKHIYKIASKVKE